MQRLQRLQGHRHLLTQIRRGIERETLRVNQHGQLALTPHPIALGSALTNKYITTDYSEALLELITQTHTSVNELLSELNAIHTFTLKQLGQESIWLQSMPCELPDEADIPIAWYGHSNSGTLRHVYRKGLAVRYGKAMQCIAGLHYNFSLPDELWSILDFDGNTAQDRQSNGYMALIRNFKRYSWLLMYLFGASPALNQSFLKGHQHNLLPLNTDTAYLPYATSLRMSDLGYHNNAQNKIKSCYNSVSNYTQIIYDAVTQSWPAYEKIGTLSNGEWIQLNTNILQIENEFYATIRPKRIVGRCERPNTVLMEQGVQYIEVRCLDIDPFSVVGVSPETCYFTDAFLLYCALSDSPLFSDVGYCKEGENNFNFVVNQGRAPDLQLQRNGQTIGLQDWGLQLIENILPVAQELDIARNTTAYTEALNLQQQKLLDIKLTPSAMFLSKLEHSSLSFNDFVLQESIQGTKQLQSAQISPAMEQQLTQESEHSIIAQKNLEDSDSIDFATYVHEYEAALKPPNGLN